MKNILSYSISHGSTPTSQKTLKVKYTLSILMLVGALISCNNDDAGMDAGGGGGTGGFPKTDISGYDPDDIPSKSDPLPNLLADESFENGEWFACGDAEIVQDASAHTGDQMAVIGNNAVCEAADVPFFSTRNAILIQALNLEQLPELLTVSFWIKADTVIPEGALTVYLSNSEERFLGSLAGGQRLVSYFNEENISSEWLQVKLYFENDGGVLFLSDSPPFSLVFQLEVESGYDQPIAISIDDVKVSAADETFVQPEPLPDALADATGDGRILFLNNTANAVSTMRPSGKSLVNHDGIPVEFLGSIPQWFNERNITIAQKVFNPENPESLDIVPAAGSQVFRYDLVGRGEEIIYETAGDPGRFSETNTADNKDAIDIEVRRTSWDLERNRGALSVCGRARSPLGVSDDVCTITIVDSDDFNIINEELRGFNAVWSSDGKLAYYTNEGIYLAEVNGGGVSTELVRPQTSIGGLKQEVDFSPDGSQLVFAESAGGVTLVNGELKTMFTISTLDLATGTVKPLLNVDHGTLSNNLSWSPDGNFILYTLGITEERSQIWWLEVVTGKTGPLTTTIDASFAYWQK